MAESGHSASVLDFSEANSKAAGTGCLLHHASWACQVAYGIWSPKWAQHQRDISDHIQILVERAKVSVVVVNGLLLGLRRPSHNQCRQWWLIHCFWVGGNYLGEMEVRGLWSLVSYLPLEAEGYPLGFKSLPSQPSRGGWYNCSQTMLLPCGTATNDSVGLDSSSVNLQYM